MKLLGQIGSSLARLRALIHDQDASMQYVPFSGDWDAAVLQSSGYGCPEILESVRRSTLAVARGEAAFERDGVAFEHPQYPFPLISSLLRAFALSRSDASLLDFGGSLGTSFWQCRALLKGINLDWNVVEQPHYVDCARSNAEFNLIRFYYSISEYLTEKKPGICLLSGVLPYVRDPLALLGDLAASNFPFIIIDRTMLTDLPTSQLVIQKVPSCIYGKRVSYPAWIISRSELLNTLSGEYRLVSIFDGLDGKFHVDGVSASYCGLILDRRTAQE